MHDPIGETSVYSLGQEFGDSFFAGPQPEIPIAFGGATHVGNVRTHNEDHFAVLRLRRSADLLHGSLPPDELTIPDTYSYVMVVADGMGGMKSGEVASRMALQTMLELAGQATSWVMRLTDPDAQQIEQRVNAYVERVHEALTEHGRQHPDDADMGTTWTSIHLLGPQAVIVHLGDSRACLYRGGELTRLTRDQTMAQSLIDGGLAPASVRKFRHVLLNSLGGGHEDARASLHLLDLAPGDRLLLCSDGLSDMLLDAEIAAELAANSDPQSTCRALIRRALDNGGKDNITVVLAALGEIDD
jgi:protein phosphatase